MLLPYYQEGLVRTTRCDPECAQLADRHYSRQTLGHPAFVGPGRSVVLRDAPGSVLFVWLAEQFRLDGQRGWACTLFRNESQRRSSEIILEAERIVLDLWGPNRLFTFVNASKIASVNPGYCFLCAGWRRAGFTKGRLHILDKFREDQR